jgi:transposase-like protein
LSSLEAALAVSIRTSAWMPLDEVYEMLLEQNKDISRSAVYRCFCRENINTVPQEQKEKAKKFKEYEPGFLHVDVTYLPTFDKQKQYLFVAIDRATRILYYQIYEDKTAQSAQDFFDKCMSFFPFVITYILTDNGLEFTNRLIKSKKGKLCEKPSLLDIKCQLNNIQHRLTKPHTPQTNGMVERANGTIKNNTILKNEYQNKQEMKTDLINFLIFYNLYRRHGSIRKELNVKTPFNAIEKWYKIKPEIFIETPTNFKNKLLILQTKMSIKNQQPCET